MSIPRRTLMLIVVGFAAAALSGCTSFPKQETSLRSSLAAKREQRREQAAREFEASRNEAELKAALHQWDLGNIAGCEESLRRVLERQADHRDARLLMADVCLANDEPAKAAQHMDRALMDHPDDPQVQYAMALFLDAAGRQDEALTYYQRAASQAPKNDVFRTAYSSAREAANRRNAGGANPVAALLGTATAQAAPPAGPAVRQADFRTRAADTASPAPVSRMSPQSPPRPPRPSGDAKDIVYADPAAAVDRSGDDTPETLVQRGRVALSEGNREAAAHAFRQALFLSPEDPRTAVSAATAALRYDQPQLAIQVLTTAENRFPESADIQRTLGMAYYRAGDYRAAQLALQQALSLDKSNALSYFLMGCTLSKAGQLEAAESYLQQAQAMDPRYTARR